MKNAITEMKNTLEGINSRLNDSEKWISELEDRVVEITTPKQKKRMRRNEDRDLWDNIKCTNICIRGSTEGEEKKGLRKYLKRL